MVKVRREKKRKNPPKLSLLPRSAPHFSPCGVGVGNGWRILPKVYGVKPCRAPRRCSVIDRIRSPRAAADSQGFPSRPSRPGSPCQPATASPCLELLPPKKEQQRLGGSVSAMSDVCVAQFLFDVESR